MGLGGAGVGGSLTGGVVLGFLPTASRWRRRRRRGIRSSRACHPHGGASLRLRRRARGGEVRPVRVLYRSQSGGFLRSSQHDELEAKFFEERAALEARYQKLYGPLYSKRCEIVTGVVEVEGTTQDGDEIPEQKDKGVPYFWLTAMKNNEILADEIKKRDEKALKYLTDIKWCKIDDPKGFKIEFSFNTNPFFKNSVLTKTYHMIDEDDLILEKAIGTEIEWYPGKCLTQKVLQKKSKNTKVVTKTEDCESFFNFFSPPQVPDDDAEIDEDTAEQLQNQMEQDYDIGSTIRDKIIPHAVSWFTGEVQDEDYDGTVLDPENDDNEDVEDYDNDDDDDDDHDDD